MKLLFGVQSIQPPLTGVGRYALALGERLAAYGPEIELHCFSGLHCVPLPTLNTARAGWGRRLRPWVPFKPLARRVFHGLRDQLAQRRLDRMAGQFLYHEPNYILGPYRGPSILTIHDLSHIHFPAFHPPDRVDYLNRELPASIERADHILTVSHFVRDEIIALLGVAPERVTVTYNGVDPRYAPLSADAARPTLARYGLEDKAYLLVVGTLEPRKNLRTLIEAYEAMPEAWQRRHPLVLVGSRGWIDTAFLKRLEALQSQGRVIWPGYVPEADLPVLYAGAHGFAFPSVYEGFGLPALEAMACGVPVLTGLRSSLPEVVGEVGLKVDTESVAALQEGLERLMGDDAWRAEAEAAGPRRAAQFSWESCVDETVAVYRQVWARHFG